MSMRQRILIGWSALLLLGLAACAAGDVPSSPPPPLTLAAPPNLVSAGNCDLTPELEHWLQTTIFMRDEFLTLMDTAAAEDRTKAYPDVLSMVDKRNRVDTTPYPDCASEAHLMLADAMGRAVEGFQKYVNGETVDINQVVTDAKTKIQVVQVIQDDLIKRMDEQYKKQAQS